MLILIQKDEVSVQLGTFRDAYQHTMSHKVFMGTHYSGDLQTQNLSKSMEFNGEQQKTVPQSPPNLWPQKPKLNTLTFNKLSKIVQTQENMQKQIERCNTIERTKNQNKTIKFKN